MNWVIMYLRYDQNAVKQHSSFRLKKLLVSFVICGMAAFAWDAAFAAYSDAEFWQLMSPAEKRLDEIRDQEIQQLKIILRRSAVNSERVDLLLRLGQVYTEKYKFYFFKENEIWNRKVDAHISKEGEGKKTGSRPKIDVERSRSYMRKAIVELEKALKSVRNYDKLDELYYYLAFNYWELGKKKQAIRYFTLIANKYPNSRYATEAYRHLGDYAFESRNFKSAKSYFQRAAQDTKSPTYPRVLYGLAWSEFKNRRSRAALDTMLRAIKLSKSGDQQAAQQTGTALQNDAYDAVVLFYADVGKAERAGEFFKSEIGEEEVPELLIKLLSVYQRQGNYGSAVAVSKQLEGMDIVSKEEGDLKRFEILMAAFKLAQQKRQRSREISLLRTIAAEFGNSSNDDVKTTVKNMVANSARVTHKISLKAKNKSSLRKEALELYSLYLSTWKNDIDKDDYYQTHFYMADLFSAMGQHRQAASQYRLLVNAAIEDSGNKTIGELKRGSAEGLIYSLDSYFKNKKSNVAQSREEVDELIGAIDSFIKLYPQDNESPKFLARAAGLLKDDPARKEEFHVRLNQIIEQYPRSQQALESSIILVKDAEKRQDWESLQNLISQFLANRDLMSHDKDGKFQKELISIREAAKFKVVRGIEKGSDFAEAAEQYEKLAAETKDSEIRFKSLNNAAVSWAKAGRTEDELRVYKEIAQRYPKNLDASKRILGSADESFFRGEYEAAATKYEEFFNIHERKLPKSSKELQELAINAAQTAAFLRDGLSDDEKTAANVRNIVEAANRKVRSAREAAEELTYDMASRYRRDDKKERAINLYRNYLRAFPTGNYAIEATVFLGILYQGLREPEKAQSYFVRAGKIYQRKRGKVSRSELSFAAQARLLLLPGLERAYYAASISLPESRLKQDIQSKLKRMEQLNKGYLEVIEYGDGKWAMEAFYKMALAYQEFAESLQRAPVPENYNDTEKAQFRAQLVQVAQPVRLKVVETITTALKKGENLAVGGDSMTKVAIAYALNVPSSKRLPLAYKIDWSKPNEWIIGETEDVDRARSALMKNSKNLAALVHVGNYHLVRGEVRFAQIYYTRAFKLNGRYVPAINNLAYLEGVRGDIRAALAGFKEALKVHEFDVVAKKNLGRVYLGSGLWRHANLAYRQLEVRVSGDKEIAKGLGLSYLALGNVSQSSTLLRGSSLDGINEEFTEAILKLGKGQSSDALDSLRGIASKNQFALMITDFWSKK